MPYTKEDHEINFDRFTHIDDCKRIDTSIVVKEAFKLHDRTSEDIEIAVDADEREALLITPLWYSRRLPSDGEKHDYTVLTQGELEWLNHFLFDVRQEGKRKAFNEVQRRVEREKQKL